MLKIFFQSPNIHAIKVNSYDWREFYQTSQRIPFQSGEITRCPGLLFGWLQHIQELVSNLQLVLMVHLTDHRQLLCVELRKRREKPSEINLLSEQVPRFYVKFITCTVSSLKCKNFEHFCVSLERLYPYSNDKNQMDAKRESDLFNTIMITDRIRRQEILLPINHNHFNF